MVSTSAVVESPHSEDEGDDDYDRPLVQRARRGADAPQVVGHKVVETGMTDVNLTHAEETLEVGSGIAPDLQTRHGTFRTNETSIGNFGGLEPEVSRGRDETLTEIDALGGFKLGPSFSSGEIRDALDPVKKLYDHAFSKLHDEISCSEKELEKLTSELNKSEASSTRKEEELGELRASLGATSEEVIAKDTEILELKRQNESVTLERDLLRGELASTQDLLQTAQKEVTALSADKARADEDASSYKRDATTTNTQAKEISEKAGQKLARAVAYVILQARSSKISFKFLSPSSFFAVVMAVMPKFVHQEEESSASASRSVGGTPPTSAIPWLPYEVPDLADWTRKVAAVSTYDERKWRDLSKGIREFSEMRSFPLREEEGSSASGPRNDNKQKESLNDEDAYSEPIPARRLKGDVSAELAALEASSLGKMAPPLSPSSIPIECTSRDTSVLPLCSSRVEGTSRDVRGQGPPKLSGVSSEHVPTEISSTGAGETMPAFNKLNFELLRHEARLRKALDEEKSLRLLCDKSRKTEDLERLWGEVGQAKYECDELKAKIDTQVAAKKNALAKASTLEVQLWNTCGNSLVQTSRIASLESDLLKMKAEAIDARAEAEEIRAKANKKVVIYLKDVVDARAELRGASDRESGSNAYARCKSRRKTLREIHARGFDLSKEIE
ncbi:COP1-interactive protein 1-like [Nicotiana sylvestris]|uniref:COP1-interactive protein 1-like n=1 Tax=Nicotiana sylvestris TaxID=4096 RepID=UPI00388C6D46